MPITHLFPCPATVRTKSDPSSSARRPRQRPGSLLAALACALLATGGALAGSVATESAGQSRENATGLPEPERQDLSATLPAGMPIEIDNPYGSVFLRFGGYRHEVGIHSTLQQPAGAAPIGFEPVQEQDRYLLAPRLPADAMLAPAQRLDIVVYVPEGHAVSARTHLGEIECRGVRSDMDLRSESGSIAARGTVGTIQAETGEGTIEIAFADKAPAGSRQRLATRTGSIVLGVTDALDARVRMATSAMIASDYSTRIERREGEEPNKIAHAVVGEPDADVVLESRRGEIRLQRRVVYRTTPGEPSSQASGPEDTR